jgi:hypothetical protein
MKWTSSRAITTGLALTATASVWPRVNAASPFRAWWGTPRISSLPLREGTDALDTTLLGPLTVRGGAAPGAAASLAHEEAVDTIPVDMASFYLPDLLDTSVAHTQKVRCCY